MWKKMLVITCTSGNGEVLTAVEVGQHEQPNLPPGVKSVTERVHQQMRSGMSKGTPQ